MILILIYIIGVIVTYIFIKKIVRNPYDFNDWDDVIYTIFMSLFSLIALLFVIIFSFNDLIKIITKNKNSKPPKWM